MSKDEAKINEEMMFAPPRIGASSSFRPNIPDLNEEPCYNSEGEEEKEEIVNTVNKLTNTEAQNTSYVVPKLLYDLEIEIFARVQCLEYRKLQFLNKQFMHLLKSSEIYRVRQQHGLVKPYVCLHSGDNCPWSIFDMDFKNFRLLPNTPSDIYFTLNDKETISVGTELLAFGMGVEASVMWRYELHMHKWFKGHSMITPRRLFGSASHGTNAFFAGGIKMDGKRTYEILRSAEKYNADTKMWTIIQDMHMHRKLSSGCFLQGKFYVLGGRDENDNYLTSGESYDENTNSWELIPDMLGEMTFKLSQSPPLIAVVDENLYLLETSLNQLLVYNTNTKSWKQLGVVPMSANAASGWGVAFKSIGDRLLLIGPATSISIRRTLSIHTCRPSPDAEQQTWETINYCSDFSEFHYFIHNCCVMFA